MILSYALLRLSSAEVKILLPCTTSFKMKNENFLFTGLGFPWLVAAIYWEYYDPVGGFEVRSKALNFQVYSFLIMWFDFNRYQFDIWCRFYSIQLLPSSASHWSAFEEFLRSLEKQNLGDQQFQNTFQLLFCFSSGLDSLLLVAWELTG